ncbi:response regulator receiver modulated diguanylate cyclase/phosphodiesterase [Caballeronia udeis]|uniref:Response regulator receiver modulated diguanylate cyclase/phosphodiesterase n=1 Tax=Caballeronia udeis TaxID=1232866 RepID=A0A158GW36_9BURK|nr:EAL domain-containing protein [Caballeronia udeis]SAL36276.1 response regulator receiver modulated diguanylate cyclase/phosphodiesterase [Caballeronia udeis]
MVLLKRLKHLLALFAPTSPGGRLATAGLVAALALMPALVFWGALENYHAGVASKKADDASDAYQQARYSVGAEESLERKYRLEPGQEIRDRHAQAATELVSWLRKARSLEQAENIVAIDDVLAKHTTYLLAIARMFSAIDANDTARANAIDAAEVDPSFDAIEHAVSASATRQRLEAIRQLNQLAETQQLVLIATPLIFAIGLVLAAFFVNVLRRLRAETVIAGVSATRRSEQRFKSLVRHAADVILICDASGSIIYRAPTAETAWSFNREHSPDELLSRWIHPDDQAALHEIWQQVGAVPGASNTLELRSRDSQDVWRNGEFTLTNLSQEFEVGGIVVNVHDVTERKLFEQQLMTQAFYDSLTSLPNRALLLDRIEQALVRVGRRNGTVGLVFFDIDNFKRVNDGLGHQSGDALLVAVAKRLATCVRPSDTVARLGGDEFVILLEQLTSEPVAEVTLVAQKIIKEFCKPFLLDGKDYVVSGSLGIALADTATKATDSASLLRNADVAMYRAKSDGKGRYAIFDADMHTDIVSRFELEVDLRGALERQELRVHYQPIVQLESEACIEVEALVRWQHPTRGLIAPLEFIPIAEETGLIIPLGLWVLEEACRHAAAWQLLYPSKPPLQVSVNLSPRQFEHADLLTDVQRALEQAGLSPTSLRLEVTEGVIMRDTESSIRTLQKLKNLGIRLAIDDFGTGYSSLSYLKMLPLDVLKIDRSFVRGIGQNAEDDAIVQAIISLAKSLGLAVTAEGIESTQQAELLRKWSCEKGQGFLFARPLEATKISALLGAPKDALVGRSIS